MTGNGKHYGRMHGGLAFDNARTQAFRRGIAAGNRANAERIPCPHCPLAIAPDGLERHINICHTDDED